MARTTNTAMRAIRRRWKAEGRCVSCSRPREAGHVVCGDCRARKKAWREDLKQRGLCGSCGKVKVSRFVNCLYCRESEAEHAREVYARQKGVSHAA